MGTPGSSTGVLRSLAPKLALALGALLVALLCAECTVRIFKLAPELAVLELGRYRVSQNPRIGYEPMPGVTFDNRAPASAFEGAKSDEDRALAEARYVNTQKYDYRERGNRLGYRDYDHEIAHPPGRFRVVLLGDSIAAGLLVADYAQTMAAALERELRAAGKDAEVLSFAVNGYNTQQEVETLVDRGLVYKPDAVVVVYCHNDRRQIDGGMMHKLLEAKGTWPPASAAGGFLVRHSHLLRLVWYLLARPTKPLPELYRSLELDTVDASLEKLAGLARQHGFSVTLAVMPTFGYDFKKETAVMAALAGRLGFRFIDMLPRFQECERRVGRVHIDRWHLNPKGHECAGRALAEFLVAAP